MMLVSYIHMAILLVHYTTILTWILFSSKTKYKVIIFSPIFPLSFVVCGFVLYSRQKIFWDKLPRYIIYLHSRESERIFKFNQLNHLWSLDFPSQSQPPRKLWHTQKLNKKPVSSVILIHSLLFVSGFSKYRVFVWLFISLFLWKTQISFFL